MAKKKCIIYAMFLGNSKGDFMGLQILTAGQTDEWDQLVKSFDTYDVYYLNGYAKAFQLHGDGDPILFYYFDEYIRAINVVMKRDIEKNKNFRGLIQPNSTYDITTPYGYGGFLIEGKVNEASIKKLNDEYSSYCRSENIVSEFVRFHPVQKNSIINKQIYDVVDLSSTITLQLESKYKIWNEISGKNRNVIRKAIKSGVKTYWGRSPELIDSFIPLYNATMKNDDAVQYYYFDREFYESIFEDLKHNSLFFYAAYDNKIISMSIILMANRNMHYHLSASDKGYSSLAATNLLLYEAASWGCENGFKTFHLGGGLGSKEDNLYKFKKAFNKNSDTYFSIGKKIFDQDKYNELLKIRLKNEKLNIKMSYFPEYRR